MIVLSVLFNHEHQGRTVIREGMYINQQDAQNSSD